MMSSQTDKPDTLSPVKRALQTVEKMQAKLDAAERARTEPIAIIGMGCRFPGGAGTPEQFWKLLAEGGDAITRAPAERWGADELARLQAAGLANIGWGGFLDQVDQFDPAFFGISGREAAGMDPQQRLLLEVAWEALERAGLADDRLAGSATGVFIGICSSEYALYHFADREQIDPYASTGTAYSLVANRLSYLLDFQGPSIALDTACSSSLVALHLACQSLRARECSLALAGGVNLILFSEGSISLAKWGMLSADGRCKTFDAAADGYVRGEGCGIVVLKRLSDALRDGDSILALVRGSAVNQDGRSAGLTAPNLLAQQAVLRQALAGARVQPAQVGYIEAHGTGTPLGDPIEIEALTAVYGAPRPDGAACLLGSVKTNIGHLEAAAGVAGLIKTVLALQHQAVPPLLHFKSLNPNITLAGTPFAIPTALTPWPASVQPRCAAISSFGFGGTNAHILLEEWPPVTAAGDPPDERPRLLMLSARSTEALRGMAANYARLLRDEISPTWADVCYSASTGRAAFPQRLALVAPTGEAAASRLTAFAANMPEVTTADDPNSFLVSGYASSNSQPRVAFLFTGQGSQYPGMGAPLYQALPVAREAIDRCAELLRPHLDVDLRSLLLDPADGNGALLSQTRYAQPALFALEWALAQLWLAWGVRPVLLLGHSLGELTAACLAGILSLEDALRLVVARGQLMQAAPSGAMAAIFAGAEVVEAHLPRGGDVCVAAVNGPTETVIAGSAEGVAAVLGQFQAQGLRTRALSGDYAFHSPRLAAIQPLLAEAAATLTFAPARLGIISTLTGKLAASDGLSQPDYWVRQVTAPVQFAPALAAALAQGVNTLIEIGPHSTLLGMAQQTPQAAKCLALPSMRRGADPASTLLRSLARLYVAGGQPDGAALAEAGRRRVLLPTYPFQRDRYWIERKAAAASEVKPAAPAPDDWYFVPRWEAVTMPAPAGDFPSAWLLLADKSGIAETLAQLLRETGALVRIVARAELTGACHDPAALGPIIAWAIESAPDRRWGVVQLWSTDIGGGLPPDEDALEAALELSCGSTLALFQALLGLKQPARLWLVSQGAQPVRPAERPTVAVAQAPLWGLWRSVAQEHPELWGGLVDLDPESAPEMSARGLRRLLQASGAEQWALRAEQAFALRLEPYRPTGQPLAIDPEGVYLITGGLGGVGLALAHGLAARGARHVALLSRNSPTREQQAALDALAAAGATAHHYLADVGDAEALAGALAAIRAVAPLKGVIHAAGVLDDGVALRQSWARTRAVLAPKVVGSWQLHQQTAADPLDWLVLCSSAAGLLGAPGQGSYAAANTWLDGLAALRQGQGAAGVAIAWGPWAAGGMQSRRPRAGLGTISSTAGVEALAALGGGTAAQVAVLPLDPTAQHTAGTLPPLLSALAHGQPEVEAAGSPATSALRQQIASAPPGRRAELLREHVRRELVSVLGLPPGHLVEPQQGFIELGLDSLMAVELRNRLQTALGMASLPATLIFDYPTLDSLTSYLRGELLDHAPDIDAPTVQPVDGAEPLAIVGMSCRFPGGADSPAAFWQLLRDGVDAVSEVPPDRWDVDAFYDPNPDAPGKSYSRWGGFVRGIDQFDPQFFGITPREAMSIDPQQRLLLETAWEALESAGQIPARLLGSRTGVFIGIGSNDYAQVHMQGADPSDIDVYFGTGNTSSAAAGRLSYVLGLQGPSMSIDTACSSSLVALHLAAQSLRSGECNLALVGGVQVMLSPATSIFLSRARALAADSACKTFDASADGYVRGEGCGVVVLKRLSEAQRDGDPILALVAGSAVNQDGRSAGFTAPNGKAQEAVIRAALAQAGIAPRQVSYVEAHGTGTPLGDPIEVQALAAVLGADRPADQPVWVGSVKTNLGHLEAAAGMAGLIKAVLALQHGAIPPSLHFHTPNPHIPWDTIPVAVPTQLTELTSTEMPRAAGVSSFGISGTNAHVILLPAPALGAPSEQAEAPAEPCLLPLSARTPDALRSLAQRYLNLLAEPSAPALAAVAAAAGAGRSHFAQRAAIVAVSTADAQAALSALADGRTHSALQFGHVPPGTPAPRVVFVCAGQGGQWAGMAHGLLADPISAQALQQVAQAAPPDLGWSLLDLLADPAAPWLERIEQLQPILFALQLALAARLQAWGITPSAVVGHSFGEVAAAHLAGALTLPDAMRVICARSQALAQRRGQGTMALVELSPEAARAALNGLEESVTIAGVNGPRSVVLTGGVAPLAALVAQLNAQSIFARLLAVDVAAHSPQLDELLPALRAALADLQPQSATLPFYSTVTGQLADGAALDAGYWANNLREPIQFWDTLQVLVADGHTHFVELGPHPTLAAALSDGLRALGVSGQVVAPLRRDRPAPETLLTAIGALYCAGAPVAWPPRPAQGHIIAALPTYPFQNERYWLEPKGPVVRSQNGSRPAPGSRVDWPGARVHSPMLPGALFETTLSAATVPFLNDHRIDGRIVVAGAAHLSLALSAAGAANKSDACSLSNIRFTHALLLDQDEVRPVQAGLVPAADGMTSFQIYSAEHGAGRDWTLHAAGTLDPTGADAAADVPAAALDAIRARCAQALLGSDLYQPLWEAGYQLGPSFRWAEQIWRGEGEALCRLRAAEPNETEPYLLHPGLLDTCFQLTAASLPLESLTRMADSWTVAVPVAVGRLQLHRRADGAAWCHIVANTNANGSGAEISVDIRLLDERGGVIAAIDDFRSRRVARADLLGMSQPADDWLYRLTWQPQPLESPAPPPEVQLGGWLILADHGGVGQALAAQLEARGEHCVTITRAELDWHSRDGNQSDLDTFRRLLAESFSEPQQRCRGIIHLWALDAPAEVTAEALAAAQALGTVSTMHLVQALAQTGWRDAPRLWLVTRGAQAVQPGQLVTGTAQAPLWGLGRTVGLEHPELACSRVDLEAGGSDGEAQTLCQEVLADGREDQIALRGDGRYVARLVRAALPPPARPASFGPEATYLIVGGLGGVGLVVARWMVEQGARHLALLGRTAPSDEAAQTLAALREAGAEVVTLQADAARKPELAAALDQIRAAMPPLRGVIHAAAVLDDGLLMTLTPERLRTALLPKADVALNLHELTADGQLDFFVLFSSLAGLLGAPGQANYAAANAFLDALAHHRRALGLPALSINWGPWAEVGLAAAHANRGQRLAQRGLASIPPQLGVAALGRLLNVEDPEIAVMSFNLRQWREFYPAAAAMPLLSALAAAQPAPDASRPAGMMRAALEAAPAGQRRLMLEAHLREQIAQVMRLEPAQLAPATPLGSLGLDSLMGLEIRNRLEASLGLTISATLIWTYPTIAALSAHFAEALGLPPEAQPAPASASGTSSVPDALRRTAEQIADLSEAEMEALLLKKLDGQGKAARE